VRPDQQDEFVVDVRLGGRFELGTRFRHINNEAGSCGQLIFETQFSGISKGATLVFPSFGSREILKSISPHSPGPPRTAGIHNPRQAFSHLVEVRRLSSYPIQTSRSERCNRSQRLSDFMGHRPGSYLYAHEPIITLTLFGLLLL